MATLEELYDKIVSDDGEKKAFAEAFATEEGAAAFMERHGCEAKPAELVAFLKEKACATGEVSDGVLEGAAGGSDDWLMSIFTFGVACAFYGIASAVGANVYSDPKAALESGKWIDMCPPK